MSIRTEKWSATERKAAVQKASFHGLRTSASGQEQTFITTKTSEIDVQLSTQCSHSGDRIMKGRS
jgi:hypothetical protein